MTQRIEVNVMQDSWDNPRGIPNVGKLFDAYGNIDPRDRRDLTWYMAESTRDELRDLSVERERARAAGCSPSPDAVLWGASATLLGRPLEIDRDLPHGVVVALVENEHERALRRLSGSGIVVVPQFVEMPTPYVVGPPPAPTLRGLLKYWWKRGRR